MNSYQAIAKPFQLISSRAYSVGIHRRAIGSINFRLKLATLPQLYAFSDVNSAAEVTQFVKENLFLLEVLLEAPKYIFSTFGRISLHLELHRDLDEDFDELFIVIKSKYSPEKARELMDKLGDEWFLNIIDEMDDKLCITEEPL